MSECLLSIGEHRYYLHMEVTVIRVWKCFHIVEIQELGKEQSFYVDICTLTLEPNLTNSISLGYFMGGYK